MKKDRKNIRIKRKEKLKKVYLTQIISTKYNEKQRDELKKFEQELLKDYDSKKLDIFYQKEFYLMPMISREYSRKQREEIKRKEKEIFEKCDKKLVLERKW